MHKVELHFHCHIELEEEAPHLNFLEQIWVAHLLPSERSHPSHLPLAGGAGNLPVTGGSGNLPLTGGPGNLPLTGASGNLPLTGGSGNLPLTVPTQYLPLVEINFFT